MEHTYRNPEQAISAWIMDSYKEMMRGITLDHEPTIFDKTATIVYGLNLLGVPVRRGVRVMANSLAGMSEENANIMIENFYRGVFRETTADDRFSGLEQEINEEMAHFGGVGASTLNSLTEGVSTSIPSGVSAEKAINNLLYASGGEPIIGIAKKNGLGKLHQETGILPVYGNTSLGEHEENDYALTRMDHRDAV